MLCFLHSMSRVGDIGDTLHIVFCNLYVDERMTSVPRLTGSSTADCDVQSTENASHIDESTELLSVQETEQDAYKRSESVFCQGVYIDWTRVQYGNCFDTTTVTGTKNLAGTCIQL